MKVTVVPNSYVLANTLAHRLPLSVKLFVLFSYIVFIFASQSPLTVLALFVIILAARFAMKLPLRNKTLISITLLLLITTFFVSSKSAFGVRLIVALGKLVCFMMVLTIFGMTTKPNDILQRVNPNATRSPLRLLTYIINITLAVLPSIQYDLQRAIDAETLRRGRPVRFYSLSSWVTILTVVLIRSISRAKQMSNTLINRCYSPSRGLTPLNEPSLEPTDIIRAIGSVALGFLIVILPL